MAHQRSLQWKRFAINRKIIFTLLMTNLFTIVWLSLRSLRANTLRTVLTLLGIVVSVIAIMLIVALGANLKSFVVGQIEQFGTDYVQIEIKVPQASPYAITERIRTSVTTMTMDDVEMIAALPNVALVTPYLMAQAKIQSEKDTKNVMIFGVGSAYDQIDQQLDFTEGAFFSEEQEKSSARVIVLGRDIAEDLFGDKSAVGSTVKLDGRTYRIVGVADERGSMGPFSFDEIVYIPTSTVQKVISGVDHIDAMTAKVKNVDRMGQTAQTAELLMRRAHNITDPNDDDFFVSTPDELTAQMGQIFTALNILLLALASISLLVGGVGIMNVMLVAVEERLSEIGLRKALGARHHDIFVQYVTESVVISMIGATIGIVLSYVLLSIAFWFLAQNNFLFDTVIPLSAPIISITFSIVAGLLFGIYPAKKAVRVSPMEAIRNE